MTIETRRALGGRQRAQCPCSLFGAKKASAGAEYRGVKQRFPNQCNETKTSRTARRRSPWSPRQHHHQSLLQANTAFVRIALSAFWERVSPDLPVCGPRRGKPAGCTTHLHQQGILDPREGPSLARRTMQDLLRGDLPRLAPDEQRDLCKGHLLRFA